MKRIAKVLCFFVGVVVLGLLGNEEVTVYAWDTYDYKGVTYEYWEYGDVVKITGVEENDNKKLELPEEINGKKVTEISNEAFLKCTDLEEIDIPDGVTRIGDYAFALCKNLKKIEIPVGVTRISEETFLRCESLEYVTIPDGVTVIEGSAFEGCSALKQIELPAGVTNIGLGAFAYCNSLERISIPDGVEHIGDKAFYYCEGLKEVAFLGGVERIDDYAFAYCEDLVKIAISEGVTHIGESAFEGCSGLYRIDMPERPASEEDEVFWIRIGEYAFANCGRLKEIKIVSRGADIGKDTFEDCVIYIPEDIKEVDEDEHYEYRKTEIMHKYTEGYMTQEEVCGAILDGRKLSKCLVCNIKAKHLCSEETIIGGSKLVAPIIMEGVCNVCGISVRWYDWSYAWISGIVAVVLLGFVVAIINYMRRMKKS